MRFSGLGFGASGLGHKDVSRVLGSIGRSIAEIRQSMLGGISGLPSLAPTATSFWVALKPALVLGSLFYGAPCYLGEPERDPNLERERERESYHGESPSISSLSVCGFQRGLGLGRGGGGEWQQAEQRTFASALVLN